MKLFHSANRRKSDETNHRVSRSWIHAKNYFLIEAGLSLVSKRHVGLFIMMELYAIHVSAKAYLIKYCLLQYMYVVYL